MAAAISLLVNRRTQKTAQTSSPLELVFDPDQFKGFQSLADAFFYNANANPQAVAYDQPHIIPGEDEAQPRPYTVSLNCERKERVLRLASYLKSIGVAPSDKVAILSFERPEWTEAEMAILTVGGIVVPAYVRDGEERLRFILQDSGASFAFAENQEQVEKLLRLISRKTPQALSQLRKIVTFEEVEIDPRDDNAKKLVVTLSKVLSERQPVAEESFAYRHTRCDDLAHIGYTSGSSGVPKGVPVTHGQILANLWQMAHAGLIDYDKYLDPKRKQSQPFVTLLLPERAHAYPGRIAELVATTPVRARYPAVVDRKHSNIDQAFRESVRRDLREGAAGIVPVVPKLLIAIQQRVRERLAAGGAAGKLIGLLIEAAAKRTLDESQGKRRSIAGWMGRLADPLRRRLARRIRRRILGPDFEFFIAGGAKLPVDTAAFLGALEIPVYEGYGTTETNCPIATNVPTHSRLGSVGKPFVGVETKVDPQTGELLIRGPNVAAHYWNNEHETAQGWTDGWYHTRDIGSADADGFLYIMDRLDNILVLQNGENVSATELEVRFAEIPYVDAAVVLGHQRPGLIALVSLNEDAVRRWAERTGQALAPELRNDAVVLALLRQEMEEKVNARAQRCFDRIGQIAIIEPLETAEQTLTATEKVNRRTIQKRYASLIESLYAESHAWHYEPNTPTAHRQSASSQTHATLLVEPESR